MSPHRRRGLLAVLSLLLVVLVTPTRAQSSHLAVRQATVKAADHAHPSTAPLPGRSPVRPHPERRQGVPDPALSQNVHLFYYPWYGATNGTYRHWPRGGHTPPSGIGANLYPTLGPYDSGDNAVIDQHMRWTVRTGAGVLVYSWWGRGSYEDDLVRKVMDAAARYGIRIAWHLEPYEGRTAASTVADITYVNRRYGAHEAFCRSAPGWEQAGEYAAANGLVWDVGLGDVVQRMA